MTPLRCRAPGSTRPASALASGPFRAPFQAGFAGLSPDALAVTPPRFGPVNPPQMRSPIDVILLARCNNNYSTGVDVGYKRPLQACGLP
jgi:hypothetical protein